MPTEARVGAPFAATPKQAELARRWRDPAARVVCVGGAIRSGKSQAAARLLVETAVERPSTYLICRSTYRELEDSTKKIVLHGDGSVPPAIPPELIAQYRASDNVVRLKTGSEILFRSLEETNISKLLNITAGAFLIDQAEELDAGEAGERIFDTLLGRLSDPSGPRKALLVCNPAGLTHWVHRRLVADETRDRDARYVHVTLHDNAQNLPVDYVAAMDATRETRPAWYRSFILGEWGAFEGQAFAEFEDAIHVVWPFEVPEHWRRFASHDHGLNHDTVFLAWAADEDGNTIVFGEYSQPGLVSKHAAAYLERRERWKTRHVWSDPSVFASQGLSTPRYFKASVATEYAEHGIILRKANNDRAAGYARLLELLHVEPGRIAPPWAQVRSGIDGAPRLYVVSTCRQLIRQLKSAPIATDEPLAGEAVDKRWESEHGHAVASLRYGAMRRPSPSAGLPEPEPDDPRAAYARRRIAQISKRETGDLVDA
jgi:PBSX family phage terminase large subunit